jgi:hypothetical protein
LKTYKIWDGVKNDKRPFKGIANAHKKIVEYAKKNKLPCIMIGEDDIKFTTAGAFKFFIQNIPEDYHIYLSGITYGKLKADNTVSDFSGLT